MLTESRGRRWLLSYAVTFLVLVIFLSIALLVQGYWKGINEFLGDVIGLRVNYVMLIAAFSVLPLVYSLVLMVGSLRILVRNDHVRPRRLNKILPPTLSLLYLLIFFALALLWGDDRVLLFEALEYLSPFIIVSVQTVLVVTAYVVAPSFVAAMQAIQSSTTRRKARAGLVVMVLLATYVAAFVTPFFLVPSNVTRGLQSMKPLTIGHRCGAALGPENTLEAAEASLLHGISGIEVDVRISLDGVPFLMHDDSLERTTDVADAFPGRETEDASWFNASELETLNAGAWFVRVDPFESIAQGLVTAAALTEYQGAGIPTLSDVLDFAVNEGLILNVDFRPPPVGHPFHSDYLNTCLTILHSAGIDDHIWVTSGNTTWLDVTEQHFPEMITALRVDVSSAPSVTISTSMTYDMLNCYHGLDTSFFSVCDQSGIPVNAWTVNALFRYDQLWCLGVDYVTTDYPHAFAQLDMPMWSIPLETYYAIWFIGGVILALAVIVRLVQSKK